MRGLNWQPLQIPFAAGVNQRADDRALPAPELAAAVDVQFDEIGGLQTRKPYSALGANIAGGGTISTARRMYANGSELVLFTKDGLYSWNDQLNRWVFRATHLAVTVDEETAFATPGDQYDGDRAELSGIVYYAWTDNDRVYVAAMDKASGAVINAPTAINGTGTRARLVALSTKVLLFWQAGTDAVPGDINVLSIDPTVTDPATLTAQLGGVGWTTLVSAATSGSRYDVTRILGADEAAFVSRRAVTTSYNLLKVAASGSFSGAAKARTCDGSIAVSSDPTGATLQVIRTVGADIIGDRITTSSLADAAINQAIGTASSTGVGGIVEQVTAAHRSVQDSGEYRCFVFWNGDEETAGGRTGGYNYVGTGGTIGTAGDWIPNLGLGSRAFDHDGRVYVWGAFGGESDFVGAAPSAYGSQLQNTYFLYRDDGTLHAKAAFQRGGGHAPSFGRLPGVALTSGTTVYSWCATERRIIPIGSSGLQKSFDKRAPRDVTFEFDSNAARRCVRLGETLYVAGGEILQYDGVSLFEVGFHIYPWWFAGTEDPTGSLATGSYTYKVTWRWENAKGERDRSTTATYGDVAIAAGPNGVEFAIIRALTTTRKTTTRPVAVEVWRTAVNPPDGAPFYLATSKDPSDTSGANCYLANTPTTHTVATWRDEFADADLRTKETNPENGDVLEYLAPPAAKVIAATDTRIFLGAVAGDPDKVWYSRIRGAGEVASFHDTLTFDVPKEGGSITGIAFLNGVCVVFRQYATYMFPGDGYDNNGFGQNYGPPQLLSADIGCRDTESIVTTPEGIAFQSSKGKYLLTRGWTMKPIGLRVADYDSETVVAAHVVPAQHQVRWVTGSRVLVWDYLAADGVEKWAEWSIASAVHAGVWNGTYHYLAAAGPLAEQSDYTAISYGMDVETAWIKPNDLQGMVSIRKLVVLGEFRSGFYLRWRIAYDYNPDWIDEGYELVTRAEGLPFQVEMRPSRRKVEAIKLRLRPYGSATQATKATSADVPISGGGFWTATLEAEPLGSLGNSITLSMGVTIDATATAFVDVRDHQRWNAATGLWSTLENNVGIRVIGDGTTTIAAIEAAINSYSDLLTVSIAHATPAATLGSFGGATIDVGGTSGGAFAAPGGESMKLTGLGLEVGLSPRLNKRFPRE